MTLALAEKDLARFMAKVSEPDERGCWLWTSGCDQGYGRFRLNDRRLLAHRVAYERFVGPIPDGMQVDHLCRVRGCVNPDHLEAVTPRENTMRTDSPAAMNARATHCIRGHEFNETNTYRYHGRRICRPCGAAASLRYQAARERASA